MDRLPYYGCCTVHCDNDEQAFRGCQCALSVHRRTTEILYDYALWTAARTAVQQEGDNSGGAIMIEAQKIQIVDQEEISKEQQLNFKEFYPVNEPFGYVGISIERGTGRLGYLTIEPTMTEEEKQTLARLKSLLKEEANVPLSVLRDETLSDSYLTDQVRRAVKIYGLKITNDSLGKFSYYVKRDFLGYGILDIL
ncbi:hypothetical protein MUP01_07670, partial [Candidatus Bathyarchaeota archaeon]|nr:hypothetical protein [Candidatus Bathyarchaeota archaeon]